MTCRRVYALPTMEDSGPRFTRHSLVRARERAGLGSIGLKRTLAKLSAAVLNAELLKVHSNGRVELMGLVHETPVRFITNADGLVLTVLPAMPRELQGVLG